MRKGKKSLFKRIRGAAVWVLSGLLGILIALMLYSRVTGKLVFSYSVLWVLSPSMEDTIPAQSYILVHKVQAEDVNENDVITFYSRDPAILGSMNTHRVVAVIGDHEEFVTRGDNNHGIDDAYHVFPEDVVAVYVRNLPVLTAFGRFYSGVAGFIVMISVLTAGMIVWFVLSFLHKRADEPASDAKEQEIQRRIAEEIERLKASGVPPENPGQESPDGTDPDHPGE